MASNLAKSQHVLIRDMLLSNSFKANKIAKVAGCSSRSIYAISSNLRDFGTTKAPSNGVGRPRSVTPPMLDALLDTAFVAVSGSLPRKSGDVFSREKFSAFLGDSVVIISSISMGRIPVRNHHP